MFCGYVFLGNVLAKVLTWHLPEHKLKPSGVCGYVFLRNVLAQVLIWHLPEHDLKPSGGFCGGARRPLGHHRASGGALGGFGRPLEMSWGPCGVSGGVPGASLGARGGP